MITVKVSTRVYKLKLPETLVIHDVFHVGLLELTKELTIESQPMYKQGLVEAKKDIEE
jgi:hypothetical protein